MGNLESGYIKGSFDDKYRLAEFLGKGSQGKVHHCVHRQLGDSYAVKIIERRSKTAWTTYRREVDLVKECGTHKNLIRVLDEFSDYRYCYVVMHKYVGHLRKGIKWVTKQGGGEEPAAGGGISDGTLRHIAQQVLGGVLHLHNGNIVHRDVKAQNVLIDRVDLNDPNSQIVISDLGLAKRLEQGGFLSAQVGTRKYWPPEIYERKYGHNMDVFAIGVLMYLAITGRYPYADEKAVRERDVFADGSVPSTLEDDARAFMQLCLEKDPTKRPSAKELAKHSWLRKGRSPSFDDLSTCAEDDSRTRCETRTLESWSHRLVHVKAVLVPEPHGDLGECLEPTEIESSPKRTYGWSYTGATPQQGSVEQSPRADDKTQRMSSDSTADSLCQNAIQDAKAVPAPGHRREFDEYNDPKAFWMPKRTGGLGMAAPECAAAHGYGGDRPPRPCCADEGLLDRAAAFLEAMREQRVRGARLEEWELKLPPL